MSDATGHLAQRTQLFCLGQRFTLLLALFALGDIHVGAQHAYCAAGWVAKDAPLPRDPPHRAVSTGDAVLEAQLTSGANGLGYR